MKRNTIEGCVDCGRVRWIDSSECHGKAHVIYRKKAKSEAPAELENAYAELENRNFKGWNKLSNRGEA